MATNKNKTSLRNHATKAGLAMMPLTAWMVIAVCLSCSSKCRAFRPGAPGANINSFNGKRGHERQRQSQSKLSMTTPDISNIAPLTDILASPPSVMLSSAASSIMGNPNVEAEVLNDMSLTLDMATLFLGSATSALRLFGVIGRLCAMSADYVPDHSIMSETFLYQGAMLFVASRSLMKSLGPIVKSAFCDMNFRDVRTYQALFQKAGISLLQYKAMRNIVIDYVTVEPNTKVEEGDQPDYMYWLYNGSVKTITPDGRVVSTISRKSNAPRLGDSNFGGLLCGRRLVYQIKQRDSVVDDNEFKMNTIQTPPEEGATLMRIHIPKLMQLMSHDESLSRAVQNMLVIEMEATINTILSKDRSVVL